MLYFETGLVLSCNFASSRDLSPHVSHNFVKYYLGTGLVSPKMWSCRQQTRYYGGLTPFHVSQQQIDHMSSCDVYKDTSTKEEN